VPGSKLQLGKQLLIYVNEGEVESPERVATVILKRYGGRLALRMWGRLNWHMVGFSTVLFIRCVEQSSLRLTVTKPLPIFHLLKELLYRLEDSVTSQRKPII
jgi:hypothetical protein